MSAYYKKLNLPKNPIKDLDSLLSRARNDKDPYHMFNVDPYSTLVPELLEAFDRLKLDVRGATVFHLPTPRSEKDSLMHTDILRVNDAWKFIICGVNWELNGINAKLSWWDTSKLSVYPMDPNYYWFDPHGIHYTKRFNYGINESTDTRLDSIDTLDGPYLVRTNVPHNVYLPDQEFPDSIRCSISIRFKNDFVDWDDAVSRFSSVIL
jgi:hypothetical protein